MQRPWYRSRRCVLRSCAVQPPPTSQGTWACPACTAHGDAHAKRQPLTAQHRAKISASLRGKYTKPKSDEHKRYDDVHALLKAPHLHHRRIALSMQRLFRDQEARLTRARAQTGRLKTCSHCGQPGHNKRGCPSLHALPSTVDAPQAPTRQKCLMCGQHGHNRRTCPQRLAQQPPSEPKRRPRCSACGGVGHQRRTCPMLHTAPGHKVAPAQPSVAQTSARVASPTPPPLPATTEAMVDAAVEAVVAAWRAGVTRQRVELLLPAPPEHNKWNPWYVWRTCTC